VTICAQQRAALSTGKACRCLMCGEGRAAASPLYAASRRLRSR
jgi:hypothetical protein